MNSLVRLHLHRTQDRMWRQANKHMSERSFNVGDMVFLKLQPYVQASVARPTHHKLSLSFLGLFVSWIVLVQWPTNSICLLLRQFIPSSMYHS
jgi:hypothetical protein